METLLAVTLFAVVMVSSYNIFRMGIEIWNRSRGPAVYERKAVLALESMARDLRRAVPIKKNETSFGRLVPEFKGTAAKINIPVMVTIPAADGMPLTRAGGVRYEWDARRKTLCRAVESMSDWYRKELVPCTVIAERIQRFELSYWLYRNIGENYAWYDRWDDGGELPQAVEMVLEVAPNPKEPEYSKKHHRTILLPMGGKKEEAVEKEE
ncbi:MAG: hypothetical protein JW893_02185 [Candidatus Omnitrophica bacterium]|nr:hypothetical protein [Candidatus Omnitrophota bacterium]